MPLIVPAQRAIRAMSRYNTTAPAWCGEASTLERAGIAQYASEELERYAPLTPLEALIGAVVATPERKAALFANIGMHHPQLNPTYLENCTNNQWSLGKDTYWKTLPEEAQLLMTRYAAVTLNMLRPKRSGDVSTWNVHDVLKASPENIQNDAMLQCIVACNNPSLFTMLMATRTSIDPQAVAIGFLHGRNVDRSWYDRMDNDAFASLIAHDKTQARYGDMLPRVLDQNLPLYRYPWDKLPLLLEHNPARFIASMVMNKDVANAHNHTERWFKPMLDATAQRVAQDPEYAIGFLMSVFSQRGRKNFNGLMERHAPDAYANLDLLRQLHGTGTDGSQEPALRAWLLWLAQTKTPKNALQLPDLDKNVFESAPLSP